jgi:type IV secretion system protein TrbC
MRKVMTTENIMLCVLLGAILLLNLFPDPVFAASSQGLPFEDPLDTLMKSITGPVGKAISLIAIVVAGVALVMGGDFSAFAKTLCWVVLAIGIIAGAANLLDNLFNFSAVV